MYICFSDRLIFPIFLNRLDIYFELPYFNNTNQIILIHKQSFYQEYSSLDFNAQFQSSKIVSNKKLFIWVKKS